MPTPRARLLHLAAGLAAAGALPAHAQTLSWTNPAGGSAAAAANWTPAQVPSAANPLLWNLAGTYSVTFPSGVPASQSHLYRRGVVTLTTSSPHTVGSAGIVIGVQPGDDATAQLTSGTLNCGGSVILGSGLTSRGALLVSGVNSDLNLTGRSPLQVGDDGLGSLTIAGFGAVVANRLLCGGGAQSVGTVAVTGSQFIAPFSRSTLSVLSTSDSIVGMSGDASLLVDAGAIASFAGGLTVGNVLGSTSSVTVEDGIVLSSRLTVAGDLNLGRNTAPGTVAGAGSLLVNTSATVEVGGTIHLGDDPDGGTGLLRTTGPSCSVTCSGLSIGPGGTLDLQDGDLRVDGGALTPRPGGLFSFPGGTGGATPTLSLRSNAAMSHSDPIQLGVSGAAELRVESASSLSNPGVVTALAINTGSQGTLVVTGAGSRSTHGALRVGSRGLGRLRVEPGAQVACTFQLETGALAGATGDIEVTGATLSTGGDMVLAGQSTAPGSAVAGGHGSLTIGPAGVVSVGGNLFGMSDSTLVINGGTLNAVRGVSVRASMTNGVINAANFASNTPMNASGLINAKISGGQYTAVGDLVLGNGAPDGIAGVILDVGAFRVDLRDSSIAEVFDVTIDGGALATPDRFHIPAGRSLQGTGTILGGVVNDGAITSTGPLGLRIAGPMINPAGGALSGTKLTFLPGASFSGRASGGGKWRIEAGASATFSLGNGGFTFIGDASPEGFVCDAPLDVQASVGIGDSDGFDLGPDCTLRNATIAAFTGPFSPNGAILINRTAGSPDTLRGAGGLTGASVTNIGLISPGFGPGAETGQIDITANYFQGQGPVAGTLELDIVGTSPAQADKIVVSHTATMDGTVRLRVPAGFHPPVGFRRTILQAASIVGGIATVDLPPQWRLERTATTLDALFCPPDFNQDGFVDFFDYDDFVQCFESGLCPPGTSADFNDDGFADFFDYDDFVLAFEHGC